MIRSIDAYKRLLSQFKKVVRTLCGLTLPTATKSSGYKSCISSTHLAPRSRQANTNKNGNEGGLVTTRAQSSRLICCTAFTNTEQLIVMKLIRRNGRTSLFSAVDKQR